MASPKQVRCVICGKEVNKRQTLVINDKGDRACRIHDTLMITSVQFKECLGCSHRLDDQDGFCYMFRDKPEELPCCQHDKYSKARKTMGKIFKKSPMLGAMLSIALSEIGNKEI